MNIIPVQDAGGATAYDSVWSQTGVPVQQPSDLERTMLAEDKLYVVLGVVLIIWIGLVYYVFRTDRKLEALERSIDRNSNSEPSA